MNRWEKGWTTRHAKSYQQMAAYARTVAVRYLASGDLYNAANWQRIGAGDSRIAMKNLMARLAASGGK
jgi:hypothetical protein